MKRERDRAHDRKRGRAQPWRALYNLKAWEAARKAQFARQPLCERCEARGRVVAATVVNHRKPHKGDVELFFDPANNESTCKPCPTGARLF